MRIFEIYAAGALASRCYITGAAQRRKLGAAIHVAASTDRGFRRAAFPPADTQVGDAAKETRRDAKSTNRRI